MLKYLCPIMCMIAVPGALAAPYMAKNSLDSLHFVVPESSATVNAYLNLLVSGDQVSGPPGVTRDDAKETWELLGVRGDYGITDRLSASASLSYMLDDSVATTAQEVDGTTTYEHSTGPSDPGFGLRYRCIGDPADGFFLDASVSGSPSFAKHRTHSPGHPGNYVGGDASASGSVTAILSGEANEAGMTLDAIHEFPKNVVGSTPNAAYHGRAVDYANLTLRDRIHVTSETYLNGALEYHGGRNYPQSYNERKPPLTAVNTWPPYYQPSLSVGHLLDTSQLVGLTLSHYTRSPSSTYSNGQSDWHTTTNAVTLEADYTSLF